MQTYTDGEHHIVLKKIFKKIISCPTKEILTGTKEQRNRPNTHTHTHTRVNNGKFYMLHLFDQKLSHVDKRKSNLTKLFC